MKLFEKIFFSHPLFQPFIIYKKSSILNVPLCSEYASGTINYLCNRLHLDVWLGSRYTSDMFKERQELRKNPVKELFLEMMQQRLEIISQKFRRKTAEKWFSSQLLSASFVRNPEAAIRGVLQRKLFLTVSQYLQENTCVGVSFWYSSRPSGLQLYQKKLHTGVFLLIFWNF